MTQHRLIRQSLGRTWSVTLAVLAMCDPARACQSPPLAGPNPTGFETAASQLRPLDTRAATTLRKGIACSTTLRDLVGALESSGLVVYIETAQLRTHSLLTLMTATPAHRFVRISLDFRNLEPSMVGWLGHEFQHAVEVAGAPDVRDQKSLERLYQRIGEVSTSGGLCTRAAQRAGNAVLGELLTCTRASR
jgi:hypothetical protein